MHRVDADWDFYSFGGTGVTSTNAANSWCPSGSMLSKVGSNVMDLQFGHNQT